MVNVANRANVAMGLRPFKLFFRHRLSCLFQKGCRYRVADFVVFLP
jgi:hypothetical protein